ncbi:MAG: (2Fe-2S)-binding protein, partial [Betaproteobacteria bacterium]|nr:(2Fe-2S)-binding protein [Betaproteobacteria bacterium]
MTVQPFRLESGGVIDRGVPLDFTFNGKRYQGCAGDTLASALLANGVHLVARSFKYHRPRGIVGSGAEEPSALVQLGDGAATLPNMRATQIELHEGLAAASQNCWPSVEFDVGSVTGLFSRLMPAGFYYKTFKWPRSLWMTYERVIRRVAGMGTSPVEPDPDHYEHRYAHCDVLVAGGGPGGLAAALAAGRSGARVILADEGFDLGGGLLAERAEIGGAPALDWVRATVAELASLPEVTLLLRSTIFGYFDHNFLAIAERVRPGNRHAPRERIWKVRAKQVVLATGAIERPLVFADNDRPGVMLASAARAYANRYAALPGRAAAIFTNNDTAYATALDLAASGIEVRAVIDARPATEGTLPQQVRAQGIPILSGHAVTRALGGRRVSAVEVARLEAGEYARQRVATFECDLVCVSGGWNPTVHLFSQSKGKLRYDERLAAFVPGESAQAERSAGAARGTFALAGCLAEGLAAGAGAAHLAGFGDGTTPPAPAATVLSETPLKPLWVIEGEALRREKCFVDLHNDVTAADIALAAREGYGSVEHLKRYTTLGMGTDQGKTSNLNGLAILAEVLGADIPEVGTTTFRPPYTPVTLGALAGTEAGANFDPV